MEAWMIVLLIVIIAVVAAIAYAGVRKRRTQALRGKFGPEYDRALEDHGDQRTAERDLKERSERRAELDIRPLAPDAREGYAAEWRDVQARFVDDPGTAVTEADALVQRVMAERGYPTHDFEQRAADVSVDHPKVVESYRAAHSISVANSNGRAGTEDLRQGLVHYRALFRELLEDDQRAETGLT